MKLSLEKPLVEIPVETTTGVVTGEISRAMSDSCRDYSWTNGWISKGTPEIISERTPGVSGGFAKRKPDEIFLKIYELFPVAYPRTHPLNPEKESRMNTWVDERKLEAFLSEFLKQSLE